jgi:hypothetical protein
MVERGYTPGFLCVHKLDIYVGNTTYASNTICSTAHPPCPCPVIILSVILEALESGGIWSMDRICRLKYGRV